MKILKRQWFVMFLLFPFLLPRTMIDFFPALEYPYFAIYAIWCVLVLCLYIYRRKVTLFIISVSIYHISLFVSIVLSSDGVYKSLPAIFMYISTIAFSMLLDMCLRESTKNILKSYIYIYSALVVINFVFLLIYPNGIIGALAPWVDYNGQYHFLGVRNHTLVFHIPYIIVAIIYSYYMSKRINNVCILMITISSLAMLLTWSATGVVSLLLVLSYLIINSTKYKMVITFRHIFIMSILLYISVVFFDFQDLFYTFIKGFLNRDISLSGRTYLWDQRMEYIYMKPVLGWGEDIFSVHAHNTVLDILVRGGIFALSLWLIMLLMCGRKLQSVKSHQFAQLISISLFAIFTAYITEVYRNQVFLYILFAFAYHMPEIIRQYDDKWNSTSESIPIYRKNQFISS